MWPLAFGSPKPSAAGSSSPELSPISQMGGEPEALCGRGKDPISQGEGASLLCSDPQRIMPVWSPPGRKGQPGKSLNAGKAREVADALSLLG